MMYIHDVYTVKVEVGRKTKMKINMNINMNSHLHIFTSSFLFFSAQYSNVNVWSLTRTIAAGARPSFDDDMPYAEWACSGHVNTNANANANANALRQGQGVGERNGSGRQIPEQLRELVRSCWASDPHERPESFDAVVKVLERCIGSAKAMAKSASLHAHRGRGDGRGDGHGVNGVRQIHNMQRQRDTLL
jgi:hypothetical protein